MTEGSCRECGDRTDRAGLKGLCYPCARGCEHRVRELVAVIAVTGARQAKYVCLRCGDVASRNLPRGAADPSTLPVLRDHRMAGSELLRTRLEELRSGRAARRQGDA
jgi:hypothetical protein